MADTFDLFPSWEHAEEGKEGQNLNFCLENSLFFTFCPFLHQQTDMLAIEPSHVTWTHRHIVSHQLK